jgi:outer membrane receptor protein involved in Fe transport
VDPELGDAIELRQPGGSVGVKGTVQRVWEVMRDSSRLEAGVDLRAWFQTQRTTPIDARYQASAASTERRQQPSALGLWAAGRIGLFQKGSLHAQVRLEQVDVRVLDVGGDDLRGSAWVAAPQGGFVVTPVPGFQLFGRYARGYRPFDGRALEASGRQTIGWTDTVELGMDGLIAGLFRLELRGFGAWSRQEAVLDPWRGGVLSVGPVRRVGGEAKAVFVPVHAVRVEIEGAAVDARDLDSRSPLPYVPPWSTAAGVYAEKRAIGPVTLAGGLRAWLAAPRRLNDGSLGKLAFGADLTARVGYRSWFFDLAADQVVPIQRVDAQSVFASDWGTGGGTTTHQISGSPFVLRLGFGVDL